MQSIRTFIAVNVAPAVAARLARLIAEMQSGPAKIKWVAENNLHFTLQFLGDVDPAHIHEISRAVQQAAAEVEPFEMVCAGLGAFPDMRRARNLWIGVSQGAEAMGELQRRIEKALKKLGFRPEARKFHPHLTLGRVKQSEPSEIAALFEGREDFNAGPTHVDKVVIYSSQLEREGPVYTILATALLGG
jgi:RNA 2',3'-cyclic 3'-phosphodiesterase